MKPRGRAVVTGGAGTAAEPYQATADREAEAEATRAREAARDLVLERDVLGRIDAELERTGLVGESRTGKLPFLALTMRLFDRPLSVAVKGTVQQRQELCGRNRAALLSGDSLCLDR